jgi:hypothetical protein
MINSERKSFNVIRTVPVVLVVPGVWAPAGVRIINDVDSAGASDSFSRTVAYS